MNLILRAIILVGLATLSGQVFAQGQDTTPTERDIMVLGGNAARCLRQ